MTATIVDMRNSSVQKRTVLIGNMIRLAATIERGTTWSNPKDIRSTKRRRCH